MATIKRQKKRPPSSSKKTTQIKFNPLRVFIRLVFLLIIWGTGAVGILLVYETTQLPDISKIDLKPRSAGIRLIASNGVEFASFGDLYKKPISFEKIPRNVIHALLATEDRRFYDHFGLDPISIIRAMAVNLRTGSIKQGGSTLTQQLAKNLFLENLENIFRNVSRMDIEEMNHEYLKSATAYQSQETKCINNIIMMCVHIVLMLCTRNIH